MMMMTTATAARVPAEKSLRAAELNPTLTLSGGSTEVNKKLSAVFCSRARGKSMMGL